MRTNQPRISLEELSAATPAEFSATNNVIIGVFLKLLASGSKGAAEAWARAHSACLSYPSDSKHVAVTLVLTPMTEADAALLTGMHAVIEDTIQLYSGYKPTSARRDLSTLRYVVMPADDHPNFARQQWRAHLALSIEASMALRTGEDRVILRRFHDLISQGSFGAAASTWGPLDLFPTAGLQLEQQAELRGVVQRASEILWDDRKAVDIPHPGLDRLSPPVATISTSELVRAGWTSLITPRQPPVVGVIVPGGNAAPGDVRSILAKADGIEIKPVIVERAPASVMTRSVMRAIDVLRDFNPVALVVGYGGTNQDGTLDAVVNGLAAELARPSPPMYLGLGHDDYRRTVEAPAARWCKTPLAAASLFLLEAVELPRERINLMEQARKALVAAFAEPDRMADVCSKLVADLRSIDVRLEMARDKYLQDQ